MFWVLEGFGYVGSVLKIIHSAVQLGKAGVYKEWHETCCYPMPMDAEVLR